MTIASDDFESLASLGAADALDGMAAWRFSAEGLVRACLARIRADEERVQAWAFVDPAYALQQARDADRARREGRAIGPLHGLPVGLKDIIDAADVPTENGTALHAGRRPARDATVVSRLRAAGAVILGKTVTTQFATYAPGKTRNPHNPAHTPGGSSSGSAAAVAANMVPAAIGTQTNGSVIRPAAYCGVYGYKPSFGLISRAGILNQSRPLDQVGVFARSVEDLAIIAEPLIGRDEADPDTAAAACPALREAVRSESARAPVFALTRTPNWADAEEQTRRGLEALASALGAQAVEAEVPDACRDAWSWHATINEADIARNFGADFERGGDSMSESLRGQIERGRQIGAAAYDAAVARIEPTRRALDAIFERCDVILTAATAGPAPRGLDSTGSPSFCTLWTYAGLPAVTLPLLKADNGMPLGVQLVGRRGDDARLLRTAHWLARWARAAPDAGARR